MKSEQSALFILAHLVFVLLGVHLFTIYFNSGVYP